MENDLEKQVPKDDTTKPAPGEAGKPGKHGGILMEDGTIVPHVETPPA